MGTMQIEIKGRIHEVVYIDYNGKHPHSVITRAFIETADKPYWRLYWFDLFLNDGDKKDLRAYESGSGPGQITAPKWINGHIGEYWLAEGARMKGKVENGVRIEKPKRVNGYWQSSINPLKAAQFAMNMEWCERCGHNSEDFCYDHKYDDDHGIARYKDNNELAE